MTFRNGVIYIKVRLYNKRVKVEFLKDGVAESVKRLLSTPKVSSSNLREAQTFSSHFEYFSAILSFASNIKIN